MMMAETRIAMANANGSPTPVHELQSSADMREDFDLVELACCFSTLSSMENMGVELLRTDITLAKNGVGDMYL
jgi:hypothetical protein